MAQKRCPNILIIMSDQHNARIMGCAGDPLIRTPCLDRLAAQGVMFENAYCAFPLCVPSRMSFMTARHPHEIDCYTNRSHLRGDIPTFAHGFLAAGYETVLAGRMHFVGPDQLHGFQRRLIGDAVSSAYVTDRRREEIDNVFGRPRVGAPGSHVKALIESGAGQTGYQAYDEEVCRVAVDWLKEYSQRKGADGPDSPPFLLTVGFVLPHCPFVARSEFFTPYFEQMSDDDLPEQEQESLHPYHRWAQRQWGIETPPARDVQRRVRAAYYGLVAYQDSLIGRIADTLAECGLAEDTIVVYTSDHGDQLGEHGLWWKCTFYEGSAAVPMIVSWPGHAAQGKVQRHNVSLMDLGPTLLDLVGAAPLPGVAGRSFSNLLDGRRSPEWDDEVFAEFCYEPHMGIAEDEITPQRMIRKGHWKYNYYYGAEPQLFNIEEDPGEMLDLAGDPEFTQICRSLEERILTDWDPVRIRRRLLTENEELALVSNWEKTVQPAHPDPPWCESPCLNTFSRIPGPPSCECPGPAPER